MRNAMWVGGGITSMGEIPILGVREKGIAKVIRDIFRNGEQGFFYDPSDLSTMFQDAAGTVPVTGAGQPVGLMLDKSRGLAYGSERVVGGNFENGLIGASADDGQSVSTWTLNTQNPISGSQDGLLHITTQSNLRPVLSFTNSTPKKVGEVYETSFDYKVIEGNFSLGYVHNGTGAVPISRKLEGTGTCTVQYLALGVSTTEGLYFNNSTGKIQIDNVRCRRVLGNHAYQTTSASRPILRKNAATGANYLEFDGSDDFLKTNAIDFTATDKVGLFAGVRKLSDIDSRTVVELSASTLSNNGSFGLFTPNLAPTKDVTIFLKGTGGRLALVADNYAAPISVLVTAKLDISASNDQYLKVNGAVRTSVLSVGSDSFGNYPLYIGRRGGVSYPLNGHIYSLIGVGKLVSDIETLAIEKELAKRTGVTLSV